MLPEDTPGAGIVCNALGQLDCLAITDHNSFAGGIVAARFARQHTDFTTYPGCEVSGKDSHVIVTFEGSVPDRAVVELPKRVGQPGISRNGLTT